MIYLIICVVIFIGLIIFVCLIDKDNKTYIFFLSCLGVEVCLLTQLILHFIFSDIYIDKSYKPIETIVEEYELYNLKDNTNKERAYLRLGSIERGAFKEEFYYYFYTKENTGLKFNKVSEDENVYIRYCVDEEKPKYTKVKETPSCILKKEVNIWTSDLLSYFSYRNKQVGDVVENTEVEDSEKIIFYVPEGSIEGNFEIDLE